MFRAFNCISTTPNQQPDPASTADDATAISSSSTQSQPQIISSSAAASSSSHLLMKMLNNNGNHHYQQQQQQQYHPNKLIEHLTQCRFLFDKFAAGFNPTNETAATSIINNNNNFNGNSCNKKRPRSTFPFGKCKVCSDKATGVHYGVATCEGCKVRRLNISRFL